MLYFDYFIQLTPSFNFLKNNRPNFNFKIQITIKMKIKTNDYNLYMHGFKPLSQGIIEASTTPKPT